MTKKDYIVIANAMKAATKFAVYRNSVDARDTHALICNELAANLKMTNPRFDRIKFLSACGLSSEVVESL